MSSPGLKFSGIEIVKVVFERDPSHKEGDFIVDVQEVTQYHKDDNKKFRVNLVVSMKSKDKPSFALMVQAISDFEIIGEIPEAVYDNYTKISAPSICYPFLRAFISTIMTQAGMLPVHIPPVNFAALKSNSIEIDPAVKPDDPSQNSPVVEKI